MFVDKYTGKVKWLNVIIAKAGIIGAIALSTHYGAQYNAFVKNAENMILHGPRWAAEGFYRGDADVQVEINKTGDIERYVVFLPSGEKYALGEDGYPKEPEQLIQGLESRIKNTDEAERKDIVEKLNQIEKKYSN